MSWNYRILRYAKGGYGIHEVYYNDAGDPTSCTETAVGVVGDEITDLFSDLAMMTKAMTEPVLEYAIFEAIAAEKRSTP